MTFILQFQKQCSKFKIEVTAMPSNIEQYISKCMGKKSNYF